MRVKHWVITLFICLLYMPPDCYSHSNSMQYRQLHRLIQKLLPRLRESGNHHVILIHQHNVPNTNKVQHSLVNGVSANSQTPNSDQENSHAPAMDQIEARAPAKDQIEARAPAIYQNEARAPAIYQNEARTPARDQNEAQAPARDQNEARAPAVQKNETWVPTKSHKEAPTARVVSDFDNIQHGSTNTGNTYSALVQNNGTQDSGNNDKYPKPSRSDLSLRESSTSDILRDINSKTPLDKKSDQSASQSIKHNQYNKMDTSQSDVEPASSKRTIPVVMETEVPEPIRTADSKYPHIQSMEKFKLAQQRNSIKTLHQSDGRILSMSKIANLGKIQTIPFFKGIGGMMATKPFNAKGKNQRLTNNMLRDFNKAFSKWVGKRKGTQPSMTSPENDLMKSWFSSQAAPGNKKQSSTRNSNPNWSNLSAVTKKGLRLRESDLYATNDFPTRETNVMQQASVNSNVKPQTPETVPKTAPSKPSEVKQYLNSDSERFRNQKSITHVNNVMTSGHAHPLTVTTKAPLMQDTDPLAVERALLYGRHALVPSGREKSGTDTRDPSQAPSWNDLGLKAPNDAKDTSYEMLEQLLLHQP